ncbi:succinate dehydrogenase / fumarate reductase membrane anchor subunit [Stella humosa]|uniref:Succinate dehydrogenase hydrophobic membrane anchor subunit n=1 Tax=Stella humosa TaxID=94 RepID=A0A3N1LI99_9PROT|nr:succinate dehydrogenase, hydrophobic membrane anchor protein [Stella humosa]ROP91257.1 succinate dehydrogenase / fumarate reductase membrane anchor subunit [Stella humosa]
MKMRSSLGRVRGLGSAKDGVHHWWVQRLTAVALVPLALWFVAALVCQVGASHASVTAWLSSPLPAIVMVLLSIATFYHAALGLQVVIEDYVSHEGLRLVAIAAMKLACFGLAVAAIFAVLKIAL